MYKIPRTLAGPAAAPSRPSSEMGVDETVQRIRRGPAARLLSGKPDIPADIVE